MGLFDETEESGPADDDKNRLFETHQRAGRSIRDYVKFLIPIVLLVFAGIAAVMYFSLPGVGDKVRPQDDLEDAVYDQMVLKEKRTVKEMTFYYCGDFYWAKVDVEPRELLPGKPPDPTVKYVAKATKQQDGKWNVSAVPMTSSDNETPCQ